MLVFEVQQYEVHVSTYRIEADDEAEAIAKLYSGDGEMVSFEFAGIADDVGMSVSENPELASRSLTWVRYNPTTPSFARFGASSKWTRSKEYERSDRHSRR